MAAIDTNIGARTDGSGPEDEWTSHPRWPAGGAAWSDGRLGRAARDRRFPLVGLRGSLRRRQPLPAHGFPAAQGERCRRHPHLPLASRPLRSGERRHVRSLGRRRPNLPHRHRGRHRLRRCATAWRRPRGARQGTALGRSGAGSQSGRRQERPRVARGRCPAGRDPGDRRSLRRDLPARRLGGRFDDSHRDGQPPTEAAPGGPGARPVPRSGQRRQRLRGATAPLCARSPPNARCSPWRPIACKGGSVASSTSATPTAPSARS